MEITLEKIELVKDRTGVSYREAKEALEAAKGNVVDAIIKIEDGINIGAGRKLSGNGTVVIEKVKEYVRKGNVSRILIRRENEVMLNIPVTVGVVGTALAPWVTVIGSIIALGMKCEIQLIKDDGTIVDLTNKMNDAVDDAREKAGDAMDKVSNKASDAAGVIREKKEKVKSDAHEIKDIVDHAAKEIKEKKKKND